MTHTDLKNANLQLSKIYPGDCSARQPVHTVYGGAHLFGPQTFSKLKESAVATFNEYAPGPEALRLALTGNDSHDSKGQLADSGLWTEIHRRVGEKLAREPVEDFRIDFEDGYGTRTDAEEDAHAKSVGEALNEHRALPPFIGIRIKALTNPCAGRAERTLSIVLKGLDQKVPEGFRITLPKVSTARQIEWLVTLLGRYEKKWGIRKKIPFEFMVETTQSLLDPMGRVPLLSYVKAGRGRCIGAHLGTYDYTASHQIVATHQQMLHPACDFAKQMMKVALSQTGVNVSDGATNIMPVPIHRGEGLSKSQRSENWESVHRAWRVSWASILHSLQTGFYQGWDLHPAQLSVRFAAVYFFFLSAREASTARLKGFVEKAARATLLGDVFDDAATGQGLLNFFLRGRACGALTDAEVAATGLTDIEIATRSFAKILEMRKG